MSAGRPSDCLKKEETRKLIFEFIDRDEADLNNITNKFKDHDFFAYYISEFIVKYYSLDKEFQTKEEAESFFLFNETNIIGYNWETYQYLSNASREKIVDWYLEGEQTEGVWWDINLEIEDDIEELLYGGELYQYLSDYLELLGYENNLKDDEIQQALYDGVPFDWILEKIQIKEGILFTGKLSRTDLHKIGTFIQKNLGLDMLILPINLNNRTPIIIGECNNNKLLSYLFFKLEEKGYVVKNWQSRLPGCIYTKGGKFLNSKDLNSAKTSAKQTSEEGIWRDESKVRKKYKEIDNFINSI